MKCLSEGILQASLDDELAGEQKLLAEAHLKICAGCRARVDQLAATACRVDQWLDALSPADLKITALRIEATGGSRRWLWAPVGLAAAVAFVALLTPRPTVRVPAPVPVPAAAALPAVAHQTSLVRKPVRRRPAPRLAAQDFQALDDGDPIQIGMVVRVMVPVSDAARGDVREIPADVVIGEDGRARAIRFVE